MTGEEKKENNLIVFLLESEKHPKPVIDMISKESGNGNTLCYVCLTRTHEDVSADLAKRGISQEKIVFLDSISTECRIDKTGKCINEACMNDLSRMRTKLREIFDSHNCTAVLFDSISSLLVYQTKHDIIKFTHELVSDESNRDIGKIFLVLKESGMYGQDINRLIDDMIFFADKTVKA